MSQSYHLKQWGIVDIQGPDAMSFLQGQVTCDVHALTNTTIGLSALCNLKGRVESLFYLSALDDGIRMYLPHVMVEQTIQRLMRYRLRAQVTFTPRPTLILIGKLSKDGLTLPGVDASFEVLETLPETVSDNSIPFERACLQALHPVIVPKTAGLWTPHALGLHHLGALDFDKGCYTGQEIVARMHYLGKLKTTTACVALKDSPASNSTVLLDTNTSGTVIHATPTDTETHALVMIPKS